MASNTRSKTDSDRKLKIQELTETAALLELEGKDRSDYIRQKLDEWELEERLARERELALEKEKLQLEHERLKNEHELAMERERQATERAKIAQENETARTVAESQPASPASSQGSSSSSPNIPFEPFDEKSESVEVYLTRFEEVARYYSLPKDRWCFRLAQCLRGKAYEAYTKLPSYQREDFEALKEALLVQFELTSESYHKKFRGSRLERKETYVNLCDRLDKYLGKWLALSKMPETFEGLRNLILAEQLRDCLTQETRIYVNEQQVIDPSDIAIAADRYLAARRDTKTRTEDSKPQASTNRANSHQGKTNPPNHKSNQAVHPRPNTPNPTNYRSSHPPPKQWCNFHKNNSHDTKDCRSRGKPTHTLNSICNPAPSDAEALVLAAVSAQSGESPHPPSVEKALVNGRAVTCLNDTGCLVEAVVRESLVSPSDYIEETTQIQTVDLESPPKTLPMALINVESKYVRGRIKAIVMKSPAYDLILGCRYVFLGTPPYPSVSAPVLTRSQVLVEESDSLKVNTIPTEIREAQKQDPSLQKYLRFAQEGEPALGKEQFFFKTGLLYRRGKEPDACNQLVVPKPYRGQVMQTGHASSLSAHQGQSSTLNRIRFHYFRPGMTENIKRYVASCPQCQKMSPKNRIPPVPLGKTPLIETPFKRVSVDILEILKQTWTKDQLNDEVKTVSKYVKDLQERLQDIRSLARSNLIKARKRQEKYYNRRAKERSLNVGDKVLLLLPKNTNKLQICWQGPFEVMKKISPTNYVIKVGRKEKSYHVNLLKHYLERPSQTDPPRNLMAIAVAEDVKEPKDLVEYPLQAVETHENVTISPQLGAEQTAEVKSMLAEFHDVLSDKPGRTSLERFSMKLLSAEPIKVKAYPLPHAKAEVIKQEVEELLKAGIIAPSVSPYNAPVVLVRKPDGGHRMCIDFRRLNAVAEFQAEPLPDPATIFANLSHARYFSKFDLSRGYYQIEVEPGCRPLLAFSTPQGHYEFQTVPFGLNNSSSVFTRMMRKLLAPIGNLGIHNFIDDILIATETWSEHIALVSSLLLRLRETGLTARPSKCLIGFTRLKFLGHVIQENQLMPDEEKVAQLLEAPRPITKTGVRSFLGMCGYYQKFIPHFNSIAAPLSDLTKKDRPDKLTWNEECELAFQRLKECLTSSPVLKLPDLSRTFVLRTDASGSGLGAVLMQTAEGSDDILFPVAYASRKLNQAESNYATIELECLALVWAIEKFQAFLYGKHFTLQTDHKPLSYLSSSKHLNARLMRWSLLLQPYSFQVEHVPGSQNAAPDFLSRHCVLEPKGLNGPDGIRDYRPHLVEDTHVIGIGETSPLFSSDTSYLFRPAPGATSQKPRCALPGEIGWGVPWLVDWAPPRTGQQIVLGDFRQLAEDKKTHEFIGAWFPGPKEMDPTLPRSASSGRPCLSSKSKHSALVLEDARRQTESEDSSSH
ncbi:hypothetical protein Bpfe_014576, partial [Biomphalaria pfeifferi]